MADFVCTDKRFFDDPRVRDLPGPARALLALLLICREMSAVPGLILAGRAALAEEFDLALEEFRDRFGALERAGLAVSDWSARLVYLPDALRWPCNAPNSIFMTALWGRTLRSAPPCALRGRIEADLREVTRERPAQLASLLAGRAISEADAPVTIAYLTKPEPQQLLLDLSAAPPAMTKPPKAPPAPAAPSPVLRLVKATEAPPKAAAVKPLPGPATPDDDPVKAWAVLTAAAGAERIGLTRRHLTPTGLPGSVEVTWARSWLELRSSSKPVDLAEIDRLGAWIKAGGLDHVRVARWDHICREGALARLLDRLPAWDGQPVQMRTAGAPNWQRSGLNSGGIPIGIHPDDESLYAEMSRVSA